MVEGTGSGSGAVVVNGNDGVAVCWFVSCSVHCLLQLK